MTLKVTVIEGVSSLTTTLKGRTRVSLRKSTSRECVYIKRNITEPIEKIKAEKSPQEDCLKWMTLKYSEDF